MNERKKERENKTNEIQHKTQGSIMNDDLRDFMLSRY